MTEEQKLKKKQYSLEYRNRPENIARKRELSRIAYLKNTEYFRQKTRKWAEENKERIKELYWSKHLRYKFKMTVTEYNEMLNKQKGICKICKLACIKKLSIDHCHKTGKVRGLLCFKCNMGLGYFQDNKTLLNSAIKYLKDHE